LDKIASDIGVARGRGADDTTILYTLVKKNPALTEPVKVAIQERKATPTQVLDAIAAKYTPQPPQQENPGFLKSLGQSIARTPIQIGKALVGLTDLVGSRVTSDPTRKAMLEERGRKIISSPTFGQTPSYSIKEGLGKGLELGSYAIGGGGVGAVGNTTVKGLVGQGVKQGVKAGVSSGFVGGVGRGLQEDKSIKGAAGQGVIEGIVGGITGGVLGGVAAVPSAARRFISPEASDAITRAIKPAANNTGWDDAIKTALPDIAETASQLKVQPKNVDDLIPVTNVAKKSIWNRVQTIIGANKDASIDGNKIADAMMGTIDKRTAIQNPGLVERIRQVADTYRRKIPLSEAEDFLQAANNDLESYYAKNKVGQRVALGDPEKAFVVREAEALRSQMYGLLDSLGSPEARTLKKRYGNLTNFEKELLRRRNVAARQNPESLAEQLSFASGAAKVLKSAANTNFGDAIEGASQMVGARYLKNKNTTDALIETAFTKLLKKPGYVEKVPFAKSTKGPFIIPPGLQKRRLLEKEVNNAATGVTKALPAKGQTTSPTIYQPSRVITNSAEQTATNAKISKVRTIKPTGTSMRKEVTQIFPGNKKEMVKELGIPKKLKDLAAKVNQRLNEITPALSTKSKYTVTYTNKSGEKVVMKDLDRTDARGWLKFLEEQGLEYTVKAGGTSAVVYAVKKGAEK
jgi:hypothetical protein